MPQHREPGVHDQVEWRFARATIEIKEKKNIIYTYKRDVDGRTRDRFPVLHSHRRVAFRSLFYIKRRGKCAGKFAGVFLLRTAPAIETGIISSRLCYSDARDKGSFFHFLN